MNNEYKQECKGLVFKGYSSGFYIRNKKETKIEFREGIRLLKRKSCAGCKECGMFYEILSDGTLFNHISILNNIKNDQLYTLKVTNISTDFETGIVDDFDIELVEI